MIETTLALDRTDVDFMKPGQRVRAVIRLEQADDVIAVPRGALFDRDGKRVVYRWEGSGFACLRLTAGLVAVAG